MRVLHVHERAAFQGGVEQILHDLAAGLKSRQWPQALLCPMPAGDASFSAPFDSVVASVDEAKQFRPDVVVLHKWSDERLVAALQRRYPTVQVVHDHDHYCPRRHKYFPLNQQQCSERAGAACVKNLCLFERREGVIPIGLTSLPAFKRRMAVAQQARVYVAGSRYSALELAHNGFASDRIEIIAPVPAAIGQVRPSRDGEAGRMMFVGQVIRGKGLDLLLGAASQLRGEWQLDVVGEGRQLDECRQQAQQLGISHRVNFAGWVPHEQLDQWYRRASFTVVPSRWPEPFGMIGLETMSRGRPVVAFDSGGIRDWLAHGITGLMVPQGDTAALTRALQEAINTPRMMMRLGYYASRHCQRRFSHSNYLDRMQSALARAAASLETQRATG
jgi:glycosyltransferase involved in cell wall biosynthesis